MAGKLIKPQPAITAPPEPDPQSMLEPEFAESWHAWQQTPTPQTTGALLRTVKPVLDSAMRTYGGRSASPTLFSQAKLMALDAMRKYDPQRAKLRTHLMVNLQGLRRAGVRENQLIRVPERVALDSYRLNQATDELQDKLGREPSTGELADHTGIGIRRIAYVRKSQPGIAEGALQPVGDVGEEQVGVGPAVTSGTGERIWRDFIYHDLHPTDQLIMEHTLGLHGRRVLSKQQIAKKLRISASAISQRAARIQSQLDKREELGGAFFGG